MSIHGVMRLQQTSGTSASLLLETRSPTLVAVSATLEMIRRLQSGDHRAGATGDRSPNCGVSRAAKSAARNAP